VFVTRSRNAECASNGEDELPRHNNMLAMMKKCSICEKLDERSARLLQIILYIIQKNSHYTTS